MSYRRISTADIQKPDHSPLDRGAKPEFAWVPIANLRVNDDYQRPLGRANVTAIRKIASQFNWIKFGALKVAPIPETDPQQYSIIDGQHRATALALLGISQAPCLIVSADEAQQAAAFASINGDVVRVLAVTAFAALAKSGDPEAVTLTEICKAGGVTILRSPQSVAQMKPGQTIAVGTLKQMAKRYGRDVLIMALKCITETSNNVPGAVHANVIQALCEIIGGDPKLAREKKFYARFEAIELDQLDSNARFQKPRQTGDSARARLRDAIKAALDAQAQVAA